MKPNQPKGSFGIPQEMLDAASRQQEQQQQQAPVEKPAMATVSDEDAKDSEPVKIFKELGAEFTEQDFNKLIFSGFIEKEFDIIPKKLSAKFKSLTCEEYDEIDTIMSKEANEISMSNDGYNARRSTLIVAHSLMELNKKPVVKPVFKDDGSLDKKETNALKRKTVSQMAPAVTNIMIQKHGAMTAALNLIASEPGEFLKNS